MTKYVVVVATALVLTVSGGLGLVRGHGPVDGAAARTAAGGAPLVAAPGQDLTSVIASLQEGLRRVPGDAPGWATLGLAYVEQARVTGDPTYYGKADAVIARSLEEMPDDNAVAHASAAAVAAARHRFGTALRESRAALAIDPLQPNALAVRVDALTELGDYRRQLEALRVADRRQPGVPVASRYSYALELRGHLAAATRVLLTSAQSASHADRGFLLTQVAELDRRDGRVRDAATHLRQALRESPGYVPALVSRARLAVAQDRPAVAERRWRAVVARLPLPEYVTELGELLLEQGHRAAADQQFAVVRTTVRLLEANGVDTDLETALFEADHGSPTAALAQARAEWRRRHSIHVADALAWALHVNGRDRRALGYAEEATRLGTQESRLWLHRGLVEAALGKDTAASAHLHRALVADPGASPWQQARARQALAAIREGGRG
jgi:tetratricopeptide (TPR) repeat protein